ncbi:PREDICTED: uncharacterized protein LOC106725765 [Myotis brandtii]|uniref:uncharacterized protein LOC106725765 n=1 Tax=Myotis brandtii TaxID=109478 RepID=UPI0007043E1B|nr:PREDICTED: uncharacterized protein LOC106725765 [Myotis brandtii]XP_014393533.1 PREDICTED: uncharacterized protein LOC106725765 [Myotis brandtii]
MASGRPSGALWTPQEAAQQDDLGVVPVGEHRLEVGEVLCPESWKENGTHLRGCACRWHRHPILVVQGAPSTWGQAGLEPFLYPGPSALSTSFQRPPVLLGSWPLPPPSSQGRRRASSACTLTVRPHTSFSDSRLPSTSRAPGIRTQDLGSLASAYHTPTFTAALPALCSFTSTLPISDQASSVLAPPALVARLSSAFTALLASAHGHMLQAQLETS